MLARCKTAATWTCRSRDAISKAPGMQNRTRCSAEASSLGRKVSKPIGRCVSERCTAAPATNAAQQTQCCCTNAASTAFLSSSQDGNLLEPINQWKLRETATSFWTFASWASADSRLSRSTTAHLLQVAAWMIRKHRDRRWASPGRDA